MIETTVGAHHPISQAFEVSSHSAPPCHVRLGCRLAEANCLPASVLVCWDLMAIRSHPVRQDADAAITLILDFVLRLLCQSLTP